VDLNHVRAAEEKKGVVRWLRPEYQCRDKTAPQVQVKLDLGIPTKPEPKRGRKPKTPKARITPRTWPASLPEQFQAVRSTLASLGGSADALAVAKAYTRAPRSRIQDVLDTLASQGFIRMGEDGVYHLA